MEIIKLNYKLTLCETKESMKNGIAIILDIVKKLGIFIIAAEESLVAAL